MQSFLNKKEKLENILTKYKKLCNLLSYEEVLVDKKLFLKLQKEKQILEPLAIKYEQILKTTNQMNSLKNEMESVLKEEKVLFEKETEELSVLLEEEIKDIEKLLISFETANQNIIIEIVSNNDEESALLLQDISSGYLEFCKVNDFESDLSKQKNKAVINISGLGVYDLFKEEVGLHVLNQNKQKYCQVFVFDNSFKKLEFDEKDVEIITCRSSGAGGQHINTTDSSIKATHIPTSICAVSQDERSQFQNKQKALERLKEKVENFYKKEYEAKLNQQRKDQVKLLKSGLTIKTYDYTNENILVKNKQNIKLKNFLQGKEL